VGLRGATDITGFGLLGHAQEIAERSGVRLVLAVADLPFLPGAVGYADDWLFPAGTCHNERGYAHAVEFVADLSEEMQQLLYTPETSGGLLLAVPPERLAEWEQQCATARQPFWQVGRVEEGRGVAVV
jgi:selenide,water dikinase